MTTASSPPKVVKKTSLSILSSSNLNRINNLQTGSNESSPQKKERIISESTGLIKFSIKKPNQVGDNDKHDDSPLLEAREATVPSGEKKYSGIPIFVPIDQNDSSAQPQTEKDLMFKMASKQREIMELKEQLRMAEGELVKIESQYREVCIQNNNFPSGGSNSQVAVNAKASMMEIKTSIRKSASLLNFNPPTNTQEALNKTQLQFSRGLTQFTNNIQTTGNGLFSRGKELWGAKIKKDFQYGQEMIAQMFETQDEGSEFDTSEDLVDDKQFEYSVDFDLDHLNKLDIERKLKGTILEQLEEEKSFEVDLSHILSSDDDGDYGGDAVAI